MMHKLACSALLCGMLHLDCLASLLRAVAFNSIQFNKAK